jgi:beta-N-acetylhexosaminidase
VTSDREALRALAGGVLVVGLRGESLGDSERRLLEEDVRPAGVILFARNLVALAPSVELTRSVRSLVDAPLVLVDQEGGRVDRLRAWRGRSPSARELASRGVEAVAREAERTCADLVALGANFNCAPVVDLEEGNETNGVGDRAFSGDPHEVVRCARAVMDAHRAARVVSCLKHFPGLGRTREDTHISRPEMALTREELESRELVPFRALAAEAPAIMVAHASFPAISFASEPASASAPVVEGLLRGEIGYDGLVVTDDLDMGAVADRTASERAVGSLRAGCDLLLLCQDFESPHPVRDAIVAAVVRGELSESRLAEAHARVAAIRREAIATA